MKTPHRILDYSLELSDVVWMHKIRVGMRTLRAPRVPVQKRIQLPLGQGTVCWDDEDTIAYVAYDERMAYVPEHMTDGHH